MQRQFSRHHMVAAWHDANQEKKLLQQFKKKPTRQQGAHPLLRLGDTIHFLASMSVFQISNSSEDEARPIRGQATELRPRPVTLDKEIHKRRAPSLLTILSTGFPASFQY